MANHILKELWQIKEGLAGECGHDLRRLFERRKAAEESTDRRVVKREKRDPSATQSR